MESQEDDISSYFISTIWLESHDTYISTELFDSLSRLGAIEAVMTITPSLDIARDLGDFARFYGNTLKFNIKFEAIDSMRFPVQAPTDKVLDKHAQTILFDSTFLTKFR